MHLGWIKMNQLVEKIMGSVSDNIIKNQEVWKLISSFFSNFKQSKVFEKLELRKIFSKIMFSTFYPLVWVLKMCCFFKFMIS